jgi:class 3 adenylate cyclase
MAPLDQKSRDGLPDSAFAYIDSRGRRRLPVNDAAHVRNALARFNQVVFDDEEARNRALERLLKAAKRHGIVPVGFMTGQLRGQAASRSLPSGVVTFLFADIEDSTGHLRRLGDRYPSLLDAIRRLLRAAVHAADGIEVDARADELFAVFRRPAGGLAAALDIQRRLRVKPWPDEVPVRLRLGLHTGEPALNAGAYVGLAVNIAARACSAGHGGQILLTAACRDAIEVAELELAGASLRELGSFTLRGLEAPEILVQVEVTDLDREFPPLRAPEARIAT